MLVPEDEDGRVCTIVWTTAVMMASYTMSGACQQSTTKDTEDPLDCKKKSFGATVDLFCLLEARVGGETNEVEMKENEENMSEAYHDTGGAVRFQYQR